MHRARFEQGADLGVSEDSSSHRRRRSRSADAADLGRHGSRRAGEPRGVKPGLRSHKLVILKLVGAAATGRRVRATQR